MPAIVIAGALLAQGAAAVSTQHLLDALDFDDAKIVKVGEGAGASLYFGYEAARSELSPERALAALAQDPKAQALLALAREQWESDPEAIVLQAQMGLDGRPELVALEAPAIAPPRPKV